MPTTKQNSLDNKMSSEEESGYLFGNFDIKLPAIFNIIVKNYISCVKEDTHHKGQGIGLFTYHEGNNETTDIGYYFIKRYSYLWKQLDSEYKLSVPYIGFSSSEKPNAHHSSSVEKGMGLLCVGLKYILKDELHTNEEYMFKFYYIDTLDEYIPGETLLFENDSEKNDKNGEISE